MPGRYFKKSNKTNLPVETVDVLVDKPSRFTQQAHVPVKTEKLPWKIRPLFWVLGLILVLVISVGIYGLIFLKRFEMAAQTSWQNIYTSLIAGKKVDPFEGQSRKSFLILGLDEIRNQREGSQLTDTLMIATIETSGRITLISLPRDLWIDSLKTKINALYYYGEENEKNSGTALVSQIVTDITGLPIAGYFVVNMETVSAVVDAVGGIEIDIPKTFTDNTFPRNNVDIATVTDPAVLYETVTFTAGKQRLNGEMALKYMRTRHSEDQTEGNDMARVRRQQQVIGALMRQLALPQNLANPTLLGNMYHVWKTAITTSLEDKELFSWGWNLANKSLTLITTQIPLQQGKEAGVITHPPVEKYGLWVYEPVDASWGGLKSWVNQQL